MSRHCDARHQRQPAHMRDCGQHKCIGTPCGVSAEKIACPPGKNGSETEASGESDFTLIGLVSECKQLAHLLAQRAFQFEQAFVTDGMMLGRIGMHFTAVQAKIAQLKDAGCLVLADVDVSAVTYACIIG